jgi:hypothetical protein
MNDSTKIPLLCIVVDEDLKICDSSFIVTVPSDGDFGGVIGCVIEVAPSLKDMDHGKIRLYKTPLDSPIRDSHSLDGVQLTQGHLTNPLLVSYKVNEVFQEKDPVRRLDIDVIVRINLGERCTFFHLLPDKPSA